ncbi:inward rectifier potassium channel domain-containing protein [Ditylenchus destructor]|nr:inward rectifier potassium channel domain-containing protein [Ditylenchus destructor]
MSNSVPQQHRHPSVCSAMLKESNHNNNNNAVMGNRKCVYVSSTPSPPPPQVPLSAKLPLLPGRKLEEGKGKPPRSRLVAKNGSCLIQPIHVPNRFCTLYRNWFHLLIENSWRSILCIFASGFLLSWLFFGALYYFIALWTRSTDPENQSPEHTQCIANVQSFASAFLFSMESQHTIGYGTRYMTEMCPQAYVVLCIQLIIGVLLQTLLAGIVIAKVLRPKKRKQEMRFSRRAVIGWSLIDEETDPNSKTVDGESIRLADIQHRLYLAESHVKLYMATTKINSRGEKELLGVKDMNVGYDNGTDRVLLLWPVIIRHIIDEDSPFFGMTPEKMRNATDFELIMTVEGIVEATGMTFQARTSYLPEEIKWGQRFVPMVTMNEGTGKYEVDYGVFDATEPCSLNADYFLMHGDSLGGYTSTQQNELLNTGDIMQNRRLSTQIISGDVNDDHIPTGGDINHIEGEPEALITDDRPLLLQNALNASANNHNGAQHHLHHHRAGSGFA